MDGQSLCDEIVSLNLERICQVYHNWSEDHHYDPGVCKVSLEDGYHGDFGGDMNHLYRAGVRMTCGGEGGEKEGCRATDASVVVKIAPDEVRFIKEGCGESMCVDPRKAELEYSALSRFSELQPLSVPRLYALDTKHKAILMEDLCEFHKLHDHLAKGHVHSATWLEGMSTERQELLTKQFDNDVMKNLMCEFLFDKPFNSTDQSNRFNPLLASDVESFRTDPDISSHVLQLRESFLRQCDCLCHGDLACDNILVKGDEFRVIDLEFAGVGLRAYDLGLFLELLIFQLVCHHSHGNHSAVTALHRLIQRAVAAYEAGVGEERGREPTFVSQVCGLIACELMWTVFGSYSVEEFSGDPEPERLLLSLSKALLLECSQSRGIAWNIDRTLTLHRLITNT